MEEIEVPTEHLQEKLHEEAHHSSDRWTMKVALTSALLAVFAAVTALLAGHHANEAMIDQIRSSDHWAFYQAKGIKSAVLASKMDLLKSMGKAPSSQDEEKLTEYKKEQKEIEESAREKEQASEHHMNSHSIYARAVTFFQIGIAMAAIAVLTRKRKLWYVSVAFGGLGLVLLVSGILS
jgi:hypothetical protein